MTPFANHIWFRLSVISAAINLACLIFLDHDVVGATTSVVALAFAGLAVYIFWPPRAVRVKATSTVTYDLPWGHMIYDGPDTYAFKLAGRYRWNCYHGHFSYTITERGRDVTDYFDEFEPVNEVRMEYWERVQPTR